METNTNNRLIVYVGGAALALVVALGVGWFVAPFLASEPELPEVAVAPRKAQGRAAKVGRPQLGGGPVVYQGEDGDGGSPAGRRAGRAGRQAGREAGREERTAAFNQQLDDYAKNAGWDAETTDKVRSVVLDTVHGARETLSEARQAKDRDLARSGLQQLRSEQEQKLTELLGPEAAAEFSREVNVGQFFPRVAERRGGPRAGAAPERGLE